MSTGRISRIGNTLTLFVLLVASGAAAGGDLEDLLQRGKDFGNTNNDSSVVEEADATSVPGYEDPEQMEVNQYYDMSTDDVISALNEDATAAVSGDDVSAAAALAWEQAQTPPPKFLSKASCVAPRNHHTESCREELDVSVVEIRTDIPFTCAAGGLIEADQDIWQAEGEAFCGSGGDSVVLQWRAGNQDALPAWTRHEYTEASGVTAPAGVGCTDGRCRFSTSGDYYDLDLTFPEPLPTEETHLEIDREWWEDVEHGCATLDSDTACTRETTACTEGREARDINGLEITRNCWARESSYECANAITYEDRTCTARREMTTQTCQETPVVTINPWCTEGEKLDSAIDSKKKSNSNARLKWESQITATCAKHGKVTLTGYRSKDRNKKHTAGSSDGWEEMWNHPYQATVNWGGGYVVEQTHADLDVDISCGGSLCTVKSLVHGDRYVTITFNKPTYPNVTTTWTDNCGSAPEDGGCRQTSRLCTEPGEIRNVGGLDIHLGCWSYERAYECRDTGYIEDPECGQLRDAGCTETASTCTEDLCEYTYSCALPQTYRTETCTETREITTREVQTSEAFACTPGETYDEVKQVWKAEARALCGVDGNTVVLKRRVGQIGDMPAWTRNDYTVAIGVPETDFISCANDNCTYAIAGEHYDIGVSFPVPLDRVESHLEIESEGWSEAGTSTCAALEADDECTRTDMTCSEPGGTRNIGGMDVTRNCWAYDYDYRCYDEGYTPEPLCAEHEAKGCEWFSEQCGPEQCDVTYQCPSDLLAAYHNIVDSTSAESLGIEAVETACVTVEEIVQPATYADEYCWGWREKEKYTCREAPEVSLHAWCADGTVLDNPSDVKKTDESSVGTDKRWITSIKAVCGEGGRVNITGSRKKQTNAAVASHNWHLQWKADYAATVNWLGELENALSTNDEASYTDQCTATRDHASDACYKTREITVDETTTTTGAECSAERDHTSAACEATREVSVQEVVTETEVTTPYSCTPGESFDSAGDTWRECSGSWFWRRCDYYRAEARTLCGNDGSTVVLLNRYGKASHLPDWNSREYTEESGVSEYSTTSSSISCTDGQCTFDWDTNDFNVSVDFPEPLATTTIETETHLEVEDDRWNGTCADLKADDTCTRLSSTCVEGEETRTIDGLDVTRDCWKRAIAYDCVEPTYTREAQCAVLEADGCVETDETCTAERCDITYECAETTLTLDTERWVGHGCGALNGDTACTEVDRTCTEGKETRTIDGLEVTRNCWRWDYEYDCLADTYMLDADCEALDSAGCTEQDRTCEGGECTVTYECPNDPESQAHGSIDCDMNTCTVTLQGDSRGDNSVTFGRPSPPTAAVELVGDCDGYEEDGACQMLDTRCLEAGGTRDFAGVPVQQSCWDYEYDWLCTGDNFIRSAYCEEKEHRGCELKGEDCDDEYCQYTYSCEATPAVTEVSEDCSTGREVQIAKLSFNTTYEASDALGQTAATLKALDEAVTSESFDTSGTYNCSGESCEGTVSVFAGQHLECRYDLVGVTNCCDPESADRFLEADLGTGQTVEDVIGFDSEEVTALTCGQEDQMTRIKKNNGLCHHVGDVMLAGGGNLISATRSAEVYCCFDSRLGRLLQEGAREQLGIPWGQEWGNIGGNELTRYEMNPAENPDCRGLTSEELQQVDMSRIDFTEVYEAMRENDMPEADELGTVVLQYIEAQQARGESQFGGDQPMDGGTDGQ